jgi:hypothetical protein
LATGRIRLKDYRVYQDGYDLSGFGRTIGPLELTYNEIDMTAQMSDPVKGYFPGDPQVNVGLLNAVFDNTATTGLHTVAITGGIARTVLVAIGIRAAPADGDPCFGGSFTQGGYQVEDDGGATTVTIPYMGWAANAATLKYACPWGQILHANAARTSASGANTAVGYDNPTADQTLKGGYFLYQVLAGNGTATLSVDDSATNANDAAFAPLSGATSGELTFAAGMSGIIALGNGATVRRYLRWQIAFNSATSVTFVSSFHRNF